MRRRRSLPGLSIAGLSIAGLSIAGLSIAGFYVVALVGTLALHGSSLPLFEGVGPPPAYQWVKPPPAFANGNVVPKPVSTDIALPATGSPAITVATPDGQFIVDLAAAAFTPHAGDTAVRAVATPLDPATLGALPAGLAADGNAYRIEFTDQPSGTPETTVAHPGDVSVNAPYPGAALEYSSDGMTWSAAPGAQVSGQTTAIAPFTKPGWYVAAHHPGSTGTTKGGGGGTLWIAVAAGVAVVFLGIVAWVRRRPTRPSKRAAPTRPNTRGPNRRAR